MTNLLHFARLVGLVYKAAAVLIHHKQTQGVNILFSAQHHGKHRYHTVNKEAIKQNLEVQLIPTFSLLLNENFYLSWLNDLCENILFVAFFFDFLMAHENFKFSEIFGSLLYKKKNLN